MEKKRQNTVGLVGLFILFLVSGLSLQAHHKPGHHGGPTHGHGHHDDYYYDYHDMHYCNVHHDYHYYYGPAPAWMPVHTYHTEVRHVYFPAYNVYYDTWRGMYIYMNAGSWIVDMRLPVPLRRVNFARTVSVGLTLNIDRPFTYNSYHVHELSYIAHDNGYGPRYPARREGGFRDHYYVRDNNRKGYSNRHIQTTRGATTYSKGQSNRYEDRGTRSYQKDDDRDNNRYGSREADNQNGRSANTSGYGNSQRRGNNVEKYQKRGETYSKSENSGYKSHESENTYRGGKSKKSGSSRGNSGNGRRGSKGTSTYSRGSRN